MLTDSAASAGEFALDARLFFNCSGWTSECGGYSSYIASAEDEELLTANPDENSLILVYRDGDTLGFVKRVTDEANSALKEGHFHDLAAVYVEDS